MANYELNILRNTTAISSKDEAISILNAFENHMIGQPISLLYYDGEQNLKILFAIGKKDSNSISVGEVKSGPEFYDIIGETDGKIFWEQIQGNVITKTDEHLRVIDTDYEQFKQFGDIDSNIISFTGNRIYKGNDIVSSLRLEDLNLYNEITIDNNKYSGNIIDIIEGIINNIGVKWSGTENPVKFSKVGIMVDDADENTFYKVGNKLYIGSDLMTSLIEWEDIDVLLEANTKNLL